MILHKIASSPFNHLALQQCLQRIQVEDGLLLTQDAVYAVMDKTLNAKFAELRSVCVLKEDSDARGIVLESDNIRLVTYAQFVELCLEYDNIVSW